MPLYGHELGEEINALECGVDFAISLDKHTQERGERFIGQDVHETTVKSGGPKRRLVGIRLEDKRAARQGNAVSVGEKVVGAVTSGCVSPTLGASIAMAFVESGSAAEGTAVGVDTGRGVLAGTIVKLPFYKAK